MADNTNTQDTPNNQEGNVLAGFVLFKDANMDWARFKRFLKEDWDIDVQDEVKDNALVFKTDGMVVACSLMPSPVPDKEAEENAKNNIFWKEGPEVVASHNAHVMMAVMNKFDPMDQAQLFIKVAASLLKLDNAIAIYKNPTVYEKEFYINFAQNLKNDELPMPILIYVGMYLSKTGLCAFTSGMRTFGKEEIEIVDSLEQPPAVISFLLSITEYVLSEDAELKDGETIGFTDEQRLPISVGDGVSVPGTTIKIKF